jgi:hypothetical protein
MKIVRQIKATLTANEVLNSFNDSTPTMHFTIEEERNNQLNFLYVTIKKDNNRISFDIYKKPTSTDIIIPQESCHPVEQKLSAIRYLQNRIETYPTDTDCKLKEKSIIDHILHNNNYDSTIAHSQNNEPTKSRTTTHKTRWAILIYIGRETRFMTKLFKYFDIGISSTTKNNINTLLRESNDNLDNKYNRSGVHQLTHTECDNKYIGQTESPFLIRYKENSCEYTHNEVNLTLQNTF